MVGLARNTQAVHLSYEEIDAMCYRLCEMLPHNLKSLWYKDIEDAPIVAIICNIRGLQMTPGSKIFSLCSNSISDYCFFKLRHESEQFDDPTKNFGEEIFEDQQRFTKYTLPWKKS